MLVAPKGEAVRMRSAEPRVEAIGAVGPWVRVFTEGQLRRGERGFRLPRHSLPVTELEAMIQVR